MLQNYLHFAYPWPLIAAGLFVVGVLLGATLTHYSAHRAVKRPLMLAIEEESIILAGVLSDLRRYPYLISIEKEAFSVRSHTKIWEGLHQVAGRGLNIVETSTDEECEKAGRELQNRSSQILSELNAWLNQFAEKETYLTRAKELYEHGVKNDYDKQEKETQKIKDAEIMTAAEQVFAAGNDRNFLAGHGVIAYTNNPDSLDKNNPPLERKYKKPENKRVGIVAALSGVIASLIPGMSYAAGFNGTYAIWSSTILLGLLAFSIIISLVDLETLYIDFGVWWVGTLLLWVSAIGLLLASNQTERIWIGLGSVVIVAVLFEVMNLLYKLIRKRPGQGFGDTLIIVATVGIPPALTGSWVSGYWSVMGGFIAAIIGWVWAKIFRGATKDTPFAFGPWLAFGWVIAMLIHIGYAWYIFG